MNFFSRYWNFRFDSKTNILIIFTYGNNLNYMTEEGLQLCY
jgi:hypothetical protein